MKEVNVRQISLSRYDFTSMPSIIIRELTKEPDTQIFISSNLYNELLKNSDRYCIWVESIYKGFQYSDGLEKAFLFQKNKETLLFLMQMNFVSCNNDFKQLTYFATESMRYSHYTKGMKNILIINCD